jgi:hypothetical protein
MSLAAIRRDLRERLPRVVQRQSAKVLALRTETTPRTIENWKAGECLPSVPAFIMLAKNDPELRAWVLNELSIEEDPTRALAVIANALARRRE